MTNSFRGAKAAVYTREVGLQPPGRLEYDPEKWEQFDKFVEETTEAEILIVAFPEALGDTYDELIINLGKVASSGKLLAIAKPSPSIKKEEPEHDADCPNATKTGPEN